MRVSMQNRIRWTQISSCVLWADFRLMICFFWIKVLNLKHVLLLSFSCVSILYLFRILIFTLIVNDTTIHIEAIISCTTAVTTRALDDSIVWTETLMNAWTPFPLWWQVYRWKSENHNVWDFFCCRIKMNNILSWCSSSSL